MYAKLSDSKLLALRTTLWNEHMDDLKDTFARGYRIKFSKTNGRFCGFVDPAQEDGLGATVNTRIRKRQRKMTAVRREVWARNLPCRSQIYDLELQGFLAVAKKKQQEDKESKLIKQRPSPRVLYTSYDEAVIRNYNRKSAFAPVAQAREAKTVPVPAPPASEKKDNNGVRYPRPNMTPEEKADYAGSEIRRLCESMEQERNKVNKEYDRAMKAFASQRLKPAERAMKENKHIIERKSVGFIFTGDLKYVRCYHNQPDGYSTGGEECTCDRTKGDHPRDWELCEADKKLQAEGKLEIDMTTLDAQIAGLAKQIVDNPSGPTVMHNNMGGFLSKLQRARVSEFD